MTLIFQPRNLTMSTPTVTVKLGGTQPAHIDIPVGTRLSETTKWGRSKIFKPKAPTLIWAKEDNNGSIIIIDQDTVEINGEQHKLAHPLKLNMSNLYCIWINGNPAQP